jgi:YihY family inner membrane protein
LAREFETAIDEAHRAGEALAEAAKGPAQPVTQSKWYRWRKDGTALIAYLLDSEVHTYAFSVAANAIISFIPFAVLLYTLALSVFHSPAMKNAVDDMVKYFLPAATKDPNWVENHIVWEAVIPLLKRQGAQAFSLLMILVSCTGIFLPLEVALNQAWGVKKSRNYLFNQTIAFGLALLMVGLGVGIMFVDADLQKTLPSLFFHHTANFAFHAVSVAIDYVWLSISTGIASVLFFFSVYYILPNRKVPWRPVLRTSVITGIAWLLSRYVFVFVLPHLDLQSLYGPFFISVGLLFWAYVSGLILFAGAQFSVARWKDRE